MEKDEMVRLVNTHAQKIAQEFGIHIVKETQLFSRLRGIAETGGIWTVVSYTRFPVVDMEGEKSGGDAGFCRLGGRGG
ncbi:MAG: hypothetical protein LBJ90_04570, partial [Treponema sp.]|nr:hypothetical protein [Treponema sp.]